MTRRGRLLLLILLPLASLACDDGRPPSGPIPVHPVGGRVLYKGKPLPNALVVFHPANSPAPGPPPPGAAGLPQPTGTTDAEGNFRLHTYVGDDGAPVGAYKVTVVLGGSRETRNVMAKDVAAAPTVALPAKYANPAQSGLSATVKEGDNAIPPFEL